jgi:hypothetical protein
MLFAKRPVAALAIVLGVAVAGCGSQEESSIAPSARLVGATGSSPGQIILSQLGKEHIGLQTAPVRAVPTPPPRPTPTAVTTTTTVAGAVKRTTSTRTSTRTPAPRPTASVIVPYSALVYDPSGKTYVFTQRSPLTYTEVPAKVDRIDGNSAYLSSGPHAGSTVVTVGAEELFGVQTGVLAQT